MAEAAILVRIPPDIVHVAYLTVRCRPKEFTKNAYGSDSEDDSNVGKMPPSDSEDE